jgi:hypothetical protein
LANLTTKRVMRKIRKRFWDFIYLL